MATISDLLQIPHFSTSNGGTVRSDFLHAAASALGVVDVLGMSKGEAIKALWEAAQHREMPESKLSPGGTVTNEVLQDVIDGILANGVPGAEGAERGTPGEPEALCAGDLPEFDPTDLEDARRMELRKVARREASSTWRASVLEAYGNTCALTGFDEPRTLDAAHIAPYRGPAFNVLSNGLCLRTDVHRLYDRGAFAIHEDSYEVLATPALLATTYASIFHGARLRLPRRREARPSSIALRAHRLWTGLGG